MHKWLVICFCLRVNFEAPLRSLAIPEIAHGRRSHTLHSKASIRFEKISVHLPDVSERGEKKAQIDC
jgi:hypothetical protein